MKLARLEDRAAAVVLSMMVVLPLADVVLRATVHASITGAALIVQHLGLVLGMLGGAIAAREGRPLALSTLGDRARSGSLAATGRTLADSVSIAVRGFLAMASYIFLETERQFPKVLVYGIPVWIVELALPIGFAAIACRMVYRASDRWGGRTIAALLAMLFASCAYDRCAS